MVMAIQSSRAMSLPSARSLAAVLGVLLASPLPVATAVHAQQVQSAPLPPPAAQQPPAARPPAQQAPRQGSGAAANPGQARPAPAQNAEAPRTDGALRQRVEQLEEQLTDLQVSIGTLESMRGSGAAAATMRSAPGSGGADAVRVDALEQQMRQMSAQIEQLAQQVRALSAGGGGQSAGQPAPGVPPARASVAQVPSSGGFGATVVTPGGGAGSGDPIGQIIGGAQQPAQPAVATDASARQVYETGRAQLLQRDYPGAEASFDDFVRRFPNDALAGDAQYWLGESMFVRGQFKGAAAAFLKGYRTYPRSAKAPDSLMMLAISLDRLGQRDDACAAFTELSARFPNAPGYVKNRADSERRRIGCS
jgi:tol-pal system protein YbgF